MSPDIDVNSSFRYHQASFHLPSIHLDSSNQLARKYLAPVSTEDRNNSSAPSLQVGSDRRPSAFSFSFSEALDQAWPSARTALGSKADSGGNMAQQSLSDRADGAKIVEGRSSPPSSTLADSTSSLNGHANAGPAPDSQSSATSAVDEQGVPQSNSPAPSTRSMPEGSTDGSSGNASRLKAAAERRSLFVNTSVLSRSPAPPVSPSASHHQSMERSDDSDGGRGAIGSSRIGQSLSTMHEDSQAQNFNITDQDAPLSAGPGLHSFEQSSLRPSRNRSTSSAAALALHGSGPAFAAPSVRLGSAVPGRSIWEKDYSGISFGGAGQFRPNPQLQRGFSLQNVHREEDEPLSSSITSSSTGFTSAFASSFDMGNHVGSPFSAVGFGAENLDGSGTESRRHSIAGAVAPPDLGAIGGQRRAVGFEVGRTSSFTGSRDPSEGNKDQSGSGFRPFGSGSLALTDDDLAGDFDFDPLQKELNRAKQEQEREHQQRHHVDLRVPSSNAVATGAHAASMPSVFGNRGFDLFGSSPAGLPGGMVYRQPFQGARPAHGGMDSLSATWDILTPSAQLGRSPNDTRDSVAQMARQLHETSIDGDQHYDAVGADDADDHVAGTATVKASPGTSPDQARAGSRFSLSPRAKAFSISQSGGGLCSRSSSIDRSGLGTGSGIGMYGSSFSSRQRSVSSIERDPYALPVPSLQQQQFGMDPRAASSMFGSSLAGGLPPPFTMPAQSLPVPPQLSEFAINGLATLGPMPPSSGGPIGGGSGQHTDLQDLGKGVPLTSLPKDTPLYIVEFKQGRTDLFFRAQPAPAGDEIVKGDLVIVEADRGKDLGTVVNDNITIEQVQSFLAHQSDMAIIAAGGRTGTDEMSSSPSSSASSARPSRSINPKRLFAKATVSDTSLLYSKAQDEGKALHLCISKVGQRGLPMTVVAAEMQWDRRKLTFYYTASMRVDFRDLVKELFRLYKTRIWMCHLGHPSGTGMG